jgi:hypothetical protein
LRQRTRVHKGLATGLPESSNCQAEWKPRLACSVKQILSRGTLPSNSVHAELQVPSTINALPREPNLSVPVEILIDPTTGV